ncbi:hypothetical protein TrRE_jg4334 [Triparma retinervis]|uniref:Uncharacterized protein n=1 Tax=Triparma retinervis TaxID=2557542 RepID=A0A9W6ZLY7_9STRA|nr:hypothetical protein TrRE_jg4334 [Triparma retinervis]
MVPLSQAPGIDCDAGNIMITQKGIELKKNVKGLLGVKASVEHVKHKRFIYYQDLNDTRQYPGARGTESGQSKCERRLIKYFQRGWTCLTKVPDEIMNKEKFRRFKPLVKPDVKYKKEWWKMK